MTQTARLYGSSLYELAAEEQLTDVLMEQMEEVRQLFRENPEYVKLLGEPSIPGEKREELLELCDKYNLIPTVGSDFHNFSSDIKIGLGINENLKISDYSIITRLKEKKHENEEKYGA